MSEGSAKGNNPALWDKFLADLDDKLQLGLLDRLRRVQAYHFESETLFIEAGSPEDEAYLQKGAQFQQLALLAEHSTGVREVKIRSTATKAG
jgi:hypothetical protein